MAANLPLYVIGSIYLAKANRYKMFLIRPIIWNANFTSVLFKTGFDVTLNRIVMKHTVHGYNHFKHKCNSEYPKRKWIYVSSFESAINGCFESIFVKLASHQSTTKFLFHNLHKFGNIIYSNILTGRCYTTSSSAESNLSIIH